MQGSCFISFNNAVLQTILPLLTKMKGLKQGTANGNKKQNK